MKTKWCFTEEEIEKILIDYINRRTMAKSDTLKAWLSVETWQDSGYAERTMYKIGGIVEGEIESLDPVVDYNSSEIKEGDRYPCPCGGDCKSPECDGKGWHVKGFK